VETDKDGIQLAWFCARFRLCCFCPAMVQLAEALTPPEPLAGPWIESLSREHLGVVT